MVAGRASCLLRRAGVFKAAMASLMGLLAVGLPAPRAAAQSVPRYLYVASERNNMVSMFNVNSTDGTLSDNGTVSTAANPVSIVTNTVSGGTFAYVVNNGNNTIGIYKVSVSKPGKLVLKFTKSVLGNPKSIYFIPSGTLKGKFAYVTSYSSSSVQIYKVSSTDGSLSLRKTQTFPGGVTEVAFSAHGSNAYVQVAEGGADYPIYVCTISSTDGSLVKRSECAESIMYQGFHVTSTNVYANFKDGIAVWARSGNTLTHTSGDQMFGEAFTGDRLVVEPQGKYLYRDAGGVGSIVVCWIDSEGMIDWAQWANANSDYAMGITAEPSGQYAYVVGKDNDNLTAYRIVRADPPFWGGLEEIQLVDLTQGSSPSSIALAP